MYSVTKDRGICQASLIFISGSIDSPLLSEDPIMEVSILLLVSQVYLSCYDFFEPDLCYFMSCFSEYFLVLFFFW